MAFYQAPVPRLHRQYPNESPYISHPILLQHDLSANEHTDFTAHRRAEYANEQISYKNIEPDREHTTDYKPVNVTEYSVAIEQEQLQDDGPGFRARHPGLFKFVQSFSLFLFIGIVLAIPIIATYDARDSRDGDSDQRQTRNTVFYVFVMLLQIWIMSAVFYVVAMLLPYMFRFVAHYVNPAHERYWRVCVMLRAPIVILFAVISSWISLAIWIAFNDDISAYNNAPGSTPEDRAEAQRQIDELLSTVILILTYFILWAGAYFLEKILITYMTLHFHFRAHNTEILRSKRLVDALVALYNYSYTMYPTGHSMFTKEDWVIHRGHNSKDGRREISHAATGVTDMMLGSFVQGFGVVFGSEATSHWFAPRSTYALVNRALQHPAASAALAKRVWVPLVSEQNDRLTLEDIRAALGPQDKAIDHFQVLDENENGDITLSEMVNTVIEAGRKRQDIYRGMGDITHVVNTIDWLMLGILALVMLALVLISSVPLLQDIKDLIGFSLLGLGFVVGRTLNEMVQGAIFTILDHPYDVGDVVEIYTLSEGSKIVLTVKRISLLYTVFEEIGTGKCVQYTNMRSKIKRINNLSRSGKNQESILFSVDHSTTFKDIELFKQEMTEFITSSENSRDYDPNVIIRVAGIGDLSKLDIRVVFKHKSNFSNDGLRAARSSRMHCAIMAAARKVPLSKPGGPLLNVGDEGKPQYTVMVTENEAAEKRQAKKDEVAKKRMDCVEKATPDEKAALAAAEEEAAKRKSMGLSAVTGERASSTSAFDQAQFTFISGEERGARVRRSYH